MFYINKKIGHLIKRLRESRNISREQLAELTDYSKESIYKIENNLRNPSKNFLAALSKPLQFDFITYLNNINNYKSIEHFLITSELKQAIDTQNHDKIVELINSEIVSTEFTYGEPLIIAQYCKILIKIYVNKNINKAYKLCVSALNLSDIRTFNPKINMPYQYYSIILSTTVCLHEKKQLESQLYLCETMIKFLENTYFNDIVPIASIEFFYKKYYIISLNNLADTYFHLNELDKASLTVSKGIKESVNLNVLNVLPILLKLKTEIECCCSNFYDAKKTYEQFNSLCEITNKEEYFDISTAAFKLKYSNLFT